MSVEKIAVISVDVIDSSKFEESCYLPSMTQLEDPAQTYLRKAGDMLLTSRGDSFQVMLNDWQSSFLKAVYLKAFFKKQVATVKASNRKKSLDVRLSLAVGWVKQLPEDIGKTMEEPFIISGRALDKMKSKGQNFIITTNNDTINHELELECAFLDDILNGWTAAQAEVIYYLVQGLKQVEIASSLSLTQPSVSNRIQLAKWNLIERMNKRFVELMQSI